MVFRLRVLCRWRFGLHVHGEKEFTTATSGALTIKSKLNAQFPWNGVAWVQDKRELACCTMEAPHTHDYVIGHTNHPSQCGLRRERTFGFLRLVRIHRYHGSGHLSRSGLVRLCGWVGTLTGRSCQFVCRMRRN